jgi:hypothetical protein
VEFRDVMAMKRQGLAIKEITAETGRHPSTVTAWLRHGGPPQRRGGTTVSVIDKCWAAEIAGLPGPGWASCFGFTATVAGGLPAGGDPPARLVTKLGMTLTLPGAIEETDSKLFASS